MCEWQRLRSSLNHDWLKNEYLTNLDGLIVRLQASKSVGTGVDKEMQAYLSVWKRRHPEMVNLINTAEDCLSPRTFFDRNPLIHCLPEHRTWLDPLIHGLWLYRYGVREKAVEALGLLSEADQLHGKLDTELKNGETLASMSAKLEAFTDIVKQLSYLLSSFPVKVVTV